MQGSRGTQQVHPRGDAEDWIASLSDCVLLVDEDGRIRHASAGARCLLGRELDDLVGVELSTLALPGLRVEITARAPALDGHDVVLIRPTSDFGRGNGGVSGPPLPVRENGSVIGAVVTFKDVSERQRAEEERRSLDQRLREAERLESIGRLAGGIAHDFNNLLSIILNYAAFIADGLEPEKQEDLDELVRAAEQAGALTRQLLVFGRAEPLELERLNLNDIVAEMEKLLRRTLGEHIQLETRLQPALWGVTGDRARLEQIVLNLALNARDAMPHGGRLTISTANETVGETESGAAEERVVLTVADTGTGMSESVVARAFEPFFTTKAKGHGTGMGLATVYGAVSQSGGAVTLESEPGVGTEVRVTMPACHEAIPKPPAPPTRSGATNRRGRVLLVEDDDALRMLMVRILSGAGYEVLEAARPSEALALGCDGDSVDLLLTDVVMPEISGPNLAVMFRELYAETPVLFTSGYPDPEVLQDQEIDSISVIQKPFTADTLIRRVDECLAANQS